MRIQEVTRLAEMAAEKAQYQAMMAQKEVVSVLFPLLTVHFLELIYFLIYFVFLDIWILYRSR